MEQSRAITRKSASNLALAFVLLPREKRDGMSALYAFCREVDDIADDESMPAETRRAKLALWRSDLDRAWTSQPEIPVNRELQPVIRKFGLSRDHFEELLRGVEMDLEIKRYETHEQLEVYCYRVASAVGLLSIEIFGYTDPRCREYAVYLGKALQLTNILRDVRVDAERGRIYLPASELARFAVQPDEILRLVQPANFEALAANVSQRARQFYRLAADTLPAADRRSMIAAELMGAVYWRMLRRIEARRFAVFGPDLIRLGKPTKLALILRTWIRLSLGSAKANYGYG